MVFLKTIGSPKLKTYQDFIFVFWKCLGQVLYISHDFLVHFFASSKAYAAGINSTILDIVNYKIFIDQRRFNKDVRCIKYLR